jgi:hypothetical protein
MYRPKVNFSIDSALTVSKLAFKHTFKTSNIEIAGSFDHFEVFGLAKKKVQTLKLACKFTGLTNM